MTLLNPHSPLQSPIIQIGQPRLRELDSVCGLLTLPLIFLPASPQAPGTMDLGP